MYRGFVRYCFTSLLPILHAFESEIGGLTKTFELAQSIHWSPLWIETDSVYLVKVVRFRKTNVPWRFSATWTRSLQSLESILFHVFHV